MAENVAVPLTVPLLAVTVALVVGVLGAVSSPVVLIVPAVVAQVNVGCVASAVPNWSLAVAEYCCVASMFRLADAGLTVIDVSVWLTVTLTVLVAVPPVGSAIVTWKL